MNPYDSPNDDASTATLPRYRYSIAAVLSACAAAFSLWLAIDLAYGHFFLISERGPAIFLDIILNVLFWACCAMGFGHASIRFHARKTWRASLVTVAAAMMLFWAPKLAFHIVFGF